MHKIRISIIMKIYKLGGSMNRFWVGLDRVEMKKIFSYFLCCFLLFAKLDAATHTLLVTGCARSGTTYMALFLKKSGYNISHESLGQDGIVSWPMASNFLNPWGELAPPNISFTHIFHQVRNPLHVITSWALNLNHLNRIEWAFVRQQIPEIKLTDSLMVHCAKYWYYWNLLAEKKAEWRYRIEDLEEILPEFMERSGLVLDANVLNEIPKNYNAWLHTSKKITWADLERELPPDLYQKIQDMTQRYGYSLEE